MKINKFISLLAGVLLIIPTNQVSAFSTTDFLSRLASLESILQVLQVRIDTMSQPAQVVNVENNKTLIVKLGDQVVHTSIESDEKHAFKVCEAIVFDPQYMWQEMTCQYDKNTLYNDTFVAG